MRVLPTTAILLAGAAPALGGGLREAIQANVAAKSTYDYNYGDVTCTIKPDEYGHFAFTGQAPDLYCHNPNPYNINNDYHHNYAGMITAPKDVDIWGKGFIDGPVQVTEMEFVNFDGKDDGLKRRELKFRMSIQTVDEHVLAEDDRLHGLLAHDEYASKEYPSTYFTLEGTLTKYTSQAYQSNPNRRNPFPHCDRVASKSDTKDWFFWRRVKDVTITDSAGKEIPFKKVEASLKEPFQVGCGANNVNRKLGIGATFELELDGHKLDFELFADMPAESCAEHVYDYDLCYDENFKFEIDFPKDSVAKKSPEEFEYIGGFCRTNEGKKDTGKFEEGCTKEKPCSIQECEKKCEEMKSCTGYEYTFRKRKDGVICELHKTSVDFATDADADKDRCYKKK